MDDASLPDDPEPPPEPELQPRTEPGPEAAPELQGPAAATAVVEPEADEEVSFSGMIEEALRSRARSAHGIVREIHRLWPGFLEGKDGYVHPVLLELRRSGRVRAAWLDLPEGRRRVYRLTSGMPAAGPERNGALPARPSASLHDHASRCAQDLAFAPRLREEAEVEIARHLADAVAEHVHDGDDADAAETGALAEFGDPWRIRVDLGRAARGKRTVIFPKSLRESLLGFAIYDLRVLLLIVAAMVFVRLQVVTAYHIPTKSMEPTLHGDPRTGDHILVNKLAGEPERFEIWVFDGWSSERKNYVKRVVGLPGEEIDLWHGDLYVNGELIRKDGDALDALLFPLFDMESELKRAQHVNPEDPTVELLRRVQEHWDASSDGPEGAWVRAEGRDSLWAIVPPDHEGDPAELYFDKDIEDAVYDEESCSVFGGLSAVADVRMTVAIHPKDADARVFLRLQNHPEAYEAVLRGDEPGVSIRLVRTEVTDDEETDELESTETVEVLARDATVSVDPGKFTRARFSHVDRTLRLELDGEVVLKVELPALEEPPETEADESRPSIVVSRGTVAVRPLRVERDVHWTNDPPAWASPGEDEFFMLGDNSNNSTDSRTYGPTHRNRLVGTPLLVVWPFSGIRVPK